MARPRPIQIDVEDGTAVIDLGADLPVMDWNPDPEYIRVVE